MYPKNVNYYPHVDSYLQDEGIQVSGHRKRVSRVRAATSTYCYGHCHHPIARRTMPHCHAHHTSIKDTSIHITRVLRILQYTSHGYLGYFNTHHTSIKDTLIHITLVQFNSATYMSYRVTQRESYQPSQTRALHTERSDDTAFET